MKTFTESQTEAVWTPAPRVACVAGPGSGKTRVLVERVHRLLSAGIPAADVIVLTFTNAAARELEARLTSQLDGEGGPAPRLGYCGTLHSYALRVLRQHGAAFGYGSRVAVLDEDAAEHLIASKARALGCREPIKNLLAMKALGRPALAGRGFAPSVAETVVASYYDDLREGGLVDLDALLPEFLRLLRSAGPALTLKLARRHMLVDEVQDSSAQDWAIYHAYPAMDKFFVGDPDQAIYAFRGGRQDLFVDYAREPGVKLIKLSENFRCSGRVCRAANMLIQENRRRVPKVTVPHELAPLGVVTSCGYETEGEEVGQLVVRVRALLTEPDPVEPAQIAVLARTNAVAAGFRDALKAAGVPVAEPPRAEAPPDWGLARTLVDLLAQPDNDTLAFFYVAARERRRGATAPEAAAKAHGVRLEAGKARQSVNALWFKLPPCPLLAEVGPLMDREGLSAETRARVARLIRDLPASSGVLELAADMGLPQVEHVEQSAAGVHVGTVHGAKGREWDQVFLVGYEDEVTPGKTIAEEVEEEERRLAFVGVTRARVAAHFTHAAQRRATWGRQEVLNHTPSRFVQEATQ